MKRRRDLRARSRARSSTSDGTAPPARGRCSGPESWPMKKKQPLGIRTKRRYEDFPNLHFPELHLHRSTLT